eukprot:3839800-Amphidinium_carterae.1
MPAESETNRDTQQNNIEQQVVDRAFPILWAKTRVYPEAVTETGSRMGVACLLPACYQVTSLTDALAFLIGSTTKLPALSAFCIYAG